MCYQGYTGDFRWVVNIEMIIFCVLSIVIMLISSIAEFVTSLGDDEAEMEQCNSAE